MLIAFDAILCPSSFHNVRVTVALALPGFVSATPRFRSRLQFELTKRIAFVVRSDGTIAACVVVASHCLKPNVAKTTIPLVVAGVITA